MDLRNGTDGRGSVEIISEAPGSIVSVQESVVVVGSCSYRPAEAAFFCF